jgi:Sigma-70 region 2
MTLPPESEWSNLDWLTALRADSDQAWAAIRERVLRSLRAYLRSRGRTLADHDLEALAEDAVQDTLLTVRAKLDTFRNDSRFTTWVHRIAVNAVATSATLERPVAGDGERCRPRLSERRERAGSRAGRPAAGAVDARPAAHRGRADSASANHPARQCLSPEAVGSPGGGARHLERCRVQGDPRCAAKAARGSSRSGCHRGGGARGLREGIGP